MNISFEEIVELARKATLYETIINYIKSSRYVSKEDILAFLGETESDSEDGDEDVQ